MTPQEQFELHGGVVRRYGSVIEATYSAKSSGETRTYMASINTALSKTPCVDDFFEMGLRNMAIHGVTLRETTASNGNDGHSG